MYSFQELSEKFNKEFDHPHFPESPTTLYAPGDYFLNIGGKRIRPVMCLLGNELFSDLHPDAYQLANAVELFHNFTLVHDDMMDAANLRRGKTTVHIKYGDNTALLVGDVMMIRAYEYIQKIQSAHLSKILQIFNTTAKEVCEGQQLDMDFEKMEKVSLDAYIEMITLKTSVLLAASLEMGAVIGGASENNCKQLYEFGKKIGIAFQIQDDYLDAFGDAALFGKEPGGDIKQNKKTFLLIHALEVANEKQKADLHDLIKSNPADKVEKVLAIFKDCKVDEWAEQLKARYMNEAFAHLGNIAVVEKRKQPIIELAHYLMNRTK
jgi:geranylgeranyl diphosphate synthase, type II